ncbi:MAG: hypothetical protein R2825_19730 [Saprospiraceae bacterium]
MARIFLQKRNIKKRSTSQNLPDATDTHQGKQKSKSHSQGIHHGHFYIVFTGKSFLTSQNQTVHHYQGDEGSQFFVDVWNECASKKSITVTMVAMMIMKVVRTRPESIFGKAKPANWKTKQTGSPIPSPDC